MPNLNHNQKVLRTPFRGTEKENLLVTPENRSRKLIKQQDYLKKSEVLYIHIDISVFYIKLNACLCSTKMLSPNWADLKQYKMQNELVLAVSSGRH